MATTAARRIELKSGRDLEKMRRAGRVAAGALAEMGKAVRPGISTKDLDKIADRYIRDHGGIPTFLGYRGYPASICASINEEVVHGIPQPRRFLKEGDIVGIDVGATVEGFVGDTAATFAVGGVSARHQALVDDTRAALERGIEMCRPGNRIGDVSHAIQAFAESRGYGVVRDFVGHGVGRQMHEEPAVPNYGSPRTGVRLEVGLVLALEPMLIDGDFKVRVLSDGWTVVSKDGGYSAHFEHTVAVTEAGPEILTLQNAR